MMTPIFLNNPPDTAQYFNLNQAPHHGQDQHQQALQLPSSPFCPTVVASSTSLHLDQGIMLSDQSQPFSDQLQGSNKNGFFDQVNSSETYGSHNHDLFIFKKQEEDQEQNNLNTTRGVSTDNNNGSSLKWMSSKMRMMRKMINNSNGPKTDNPRIRSRIINSPDNTPQLEINSNVIRTCSDCNTTKTPLWRSGPQGPKTLCNACGIRQRKARKAAMEAAAASNLSSTEASSSTSTKITTIKLMIKKDKKKYRYSSNKTTTCVSQQSNKKQANIQLDSADPNSSSTTTSSSKQQQLRFEEFAVNLLRENAAFHRMFPQDEEEGALLLMALSYGLIQS